MDHIQLCDHIDQAVAEASAQLAEDRHPQAVLEALTDKLAALTERARRAPQRPSVVNVAEGNATVGVQMGHISGTFTL